MGRHPQATRSSARPALCNRDEVLRARSFPHREREARGCRVGPVHIDRNHRALRRVLDAARTPLIRYLVAVAVHTAIQDAGGPTIEVVVGETRSCASAIAPDIGRRWRYHLVVAVGPLVLPHMK